MPNLPKFKNPKLLELAITHRSVLNEEKRTSLSSNERLEFLGDAILSFITSKYLYQNFPTFEEGKLTNLRSNLVKTGTLAKVSEKLGIGDLLRISKGEEISGGRKNPSILADTLEAIIGALFLDQGIEPVEKFISKNLFPMTADIVNAGNLKDYKSLLQELVQEKYRVSPQYDVEQEIGPDHAKTFRISVSVKGEKKAQGEGSSKQRAEQDAAKSALEYYRLNKL